jgi:hypothetical protein
MFKRSLIVAMVIAVFAALVWATDTVTLQGERTIYTARCEVGQWEGERCTGKLVAAERFRYRVLKPHSEVFFWVVGSPDPSGRFTDCDIQDGRNWRCKANADAPRSITLQMAKGYPAGDSGGITRSFHAVSKMSWTLLNVGIPVTQSAMAPPRAVSSASTAVGS